MSRGKSELARDVAAYGLVVEGDETAAELAEALAWLRDFYRQPAPAGGAGEG